ncbi:MAG: hypothetical protein AB7U82_01080 [Blastocatellales bacterium]
MIVFCDLSVNLIEKASAENLPNVVAVCGDIFSFTGVIVSASNPHWGFEGGLDGEIAKHYMKECAAKQEAYSLGNYENQRIGNVIFTITVRTDLKATPELVRRAVRFALDNHKPEEALLLSGLGCGIGGLDHDVFVEILRDELTSK